jgi:hypothetical protein
MKHKLIIYTICLGLIGSGCEQDLVEKPLSFISPSNFFTSKDSFEAAANGLYAQLPGLYGGEAEKPKELFADYNDQPSATENTLQIWQNNPGTTYWAFRNTWQGWYQMISNANQLLEKLPGASFLTDVDKKRLEGEAKALRGFSYFNLVQLFGDIPLRTQTVQSFDQVAIPRSPQKDIYALIVADLTTAEQQLPETAAQGRVNKWVATALLAKVYLTMAGNPLNQTTFFKDARDKAIAVINSGKYKLIPDYGNVFHNSAYTSESIWEILYNGVVSGNDRQGITYPGTGYTPILLPTMAFVNSFPKGDRRKDWGIVTTAKDQAGNPLRPYYNKYVDPEFVSQNLTPTAVAGKLIFTTPIFRLAEMYLIAAEAENELAGPTLAYSYINTIRERARINKSDPTQVPALAGLSKDQFREAVFNERRWELYAEDQAWFDLKRTNNFAKVQQARGDKLSVPIGSYNNTWLIPDFEIQNNNIPQNPTYGK